MASVEEGLQAQIRNIEAKHGKTMQEWTAAIRAAGLSKHAEIVAFLKAEHGMTHGNANRVALIAREADASSVAAKATAAGDDPIAVMYAGPKAALKPTHDRLVAIIHALGPDVEFAPKKGYVSVRRKKQFCMIQPTTATRIDLGLILKGTPPTGRLEVCGSFNAMFTHRVRLARPEDVDDELTAWIGEAYGQAG